MKSLLSILILSAAIAGPAAAQDVRIRVADRDPSAVRADIYKAAQTVCYAGFKRGDVRTQEMGLCIQDVADDAEAQARAYEKAAPQTTASVASLASNSLADARPSK